MNREAYRVMIDLLSIGNGHIETAEWLLKSDVSGRLIIAKDKNGDTPAHDAAENG